MLTADDVKMTTGTAWRKPAHDEQDPHDDEGLPYYDLVKVSSAVAGRCVFLREEYAPTGEWCAAFRDPRTSEVYLQLMEGDLDE